MRHHVWIAVAIIGIVRISSTGGAEMPLADFPDVSSLPSRPELPDPLVMLDGHRVSSPQEWSEKRRPELKALFQHYMYGWLPPAAPISVKVDHEDAHYFGDKATRKLVTIAIGKDPASKIQLLLVIPNRRTAPAPVFLGLNFNGNHTALPDPIIPLPTAWMPGNPPAVVANKATDAGRGKDKDVWSVEKVIDRGYALATFYSGDIAPDHPGFADGVFPHYAKGNPASRGLDEWGAVAAWAWGLSRAVDYLVQDKDLDRNRIAVVGHSRLGKAALLAGAFDERFALTIGHQAGCGGSAPSRGKIGEQVGQINDRFPHWFDGEFKKFNEQVDRLPFDQNCLMALAAPRPLLLTNGTLDTWANPEGQFDVLKAADGVYTLLGVQGLGEGSMPPPGHLVGNKLAYHIRPGKHALLPEDWETFLHYADLHLQTKK